MQGLKKYIGFYGGTFDPIHYGHISLAIQLLEIHDLEQVWFCPALVSPYKQDREITPAYHRLKMVQLAIEKIPGMKVIDTELKKTGPSYTVDTLRELISTSDHHFALLMGEDALDGFIHWKEVEALVDLVPLLIGSRYDAHFIDQLDFPPQILQAVQRGITHT